MRCRRLNTLVEEFLRLHLESLLTFLHFRYNFNSLHPLGDIGLFGDHVASPFLAEDPNAVDLAEDLQVVAGDHLATEV